MATVVVHPKSGCVLLDHTVNGKRIRLSTGKKADKRLVGWYSTHTEEEFWKLYYKKYEDENPNKIPFSEYSDYIVEITKENRNTFSQKEEKRKVEVLKGYFKNKSIENIRASDIQGWQNEMLIEKSPKTVREYRSTLYRIFEFAYQDEIINRNPIKSVKAPKISVQEVEIFSKEERKLLLSKTDGQLHNIIKFALFSGLRAGEIIGLMWKNIDFKNNKIKVCVRIRQGTIDKPKGKKIRVIELFPQAKETLLSQRLQTGLSEYVFVSKNNHPYYSESCITESIKLLCEKCKIKKGGLQKLRKTHNTMLKENGFPIDWIFHQMGHNSEKVNSIHYTGPIKIDTSKLSNIV